MNKKAMFDICVEKANKLDEYKKKFGIGADVTYFRRAEYVGALDVLKEIGIYDEFIDYLVEKRTGA